MKFTIKRTVFIEQLNHVTKAISQRTPIPILMGVKILASEDGLWLTGSDATISIEAFIDASETEHALTIEQTGSIVLQASVLSDIVRKLSDETMQIAVRDRLQADITAGNAAFTLLGTAGDDYPRLPTIDEDSTFTLPAMTFKEVIHHTIISISTQEIRPMFTGIYFEFQAGQLKAVSTDSHRLSQRIVQVNSPEAKREEPLGLIIPGRSLNELVKIIHDDDDVEMTVSDQQILFHTRNLYLYSRLLEGNYPDTDRLLPENYDTRLMLSASHFLKAIERALIMSKEGRNHVVKLAMSADLTLLYGQSQEVGEVKEELTPKAFDGKDLTIAFNPQYMRQALRTFGDQDIVIRFQQATQPFLLLPLEREQERSVVQLITPIRTPE